MKVTMKPGSDRGAKSALVRNRKVTNLRNNLQQPAFSIIPLFSTDKIKLARLREAALHHDLYGLRHTDRGEIV